ncbi:MAG: hypothetical protein KC435_10370 [Thermomicrobiales bacterium]|nr:hypothetical protein [Thermomicrobiales bacterium]
MRILHRASRTDEIDQALNALVSRRPYDPETALVSDVIDTHTQAMSALRSDPAATGPAAGTWNRVLRANAQPTAKGQGTMSATATLQSPLPGAISAPARKQAGGFSHFVNIAASVLVVAAIAFSGWFATMHLQPSGDNSNGLLGMAQGTPGLDSATCDVEPLSVDEVMAIVENPYSAFDHDLITSRDWLKVWEEKTGYDLLETNSPAIDQQLLDGFTYPATQPSFDGAVDRANGFLVCAQKGTIGQVFVYMDPKEIQRIVLANHPVYRSEEQVRATVIELMEMPGSTFVFPGGDTLHASSLSLAVNPEIDSALVAQGAGVSRYDATRVMMFGIIATDTDGTVVYQSDATGVASPVAGLERTERFRLIIKQSSIDGQWYVLAILPDMIYVI